MPPNDGMGMLALIASGVLGLVNIAWRNQLEREKENRSKLEGRLESAEKAIHQHDIKLAKNGETLKGINDKLDSIDGKLDSLMGGGPPKPRPRQPSGA